MTLAVAALAIAGTLAVVPAFGTGTAAPIALGAGIAAVVLTAWSLMTGATPPLFIALLLLFGELGGSAAFGDTELALVPIGAGGLYLIVELAMRSMETRGRHPGWRDFRRSDALRLAGVAGLVGSMAWLVSASPTGLDLAGGIFMHGIGIAAAAAVIGVIWLLVGREDRPTDDRSVASLRGRE